MNTTHDHVEEQGRFIGESSVSKTLPAIDHKLRQANRTLPTPHVLSALLEADPRLYELCEVVGEWVWITLAEPPPQAVRATLSQLGFHWNAARQCWQHPCGQLRTRGQTEPHEKYESYVPADRAAA